MLHVTYGKARSALYRWLTSADRLPTVHMHALFAFAAGELYAECRQVTAAAGLIVCLSPCGDIVSPNVRIPKCGNFEYIVGSNVTRSCSNKPSCWGMIRYRNDEQLLQVGWVQVSSVSCTATGAANVADCGAAACRPAGERRLSTSCWLTWQNILAHYRCTHLRQRRQK